jgi:hypothetical protein
MEEDYMKRLLPGSYKEPIDLPEYKRFSWALRSPEPPPPTFGQLPADDQITVRELAILLKKAPHQIVADLMEHGVLATPTDHVEPDLVAKVVRRYGYVAKKV